MTDPIEETRRLAESHGLEFKDCGQGHVQIKGHGNVVNYWPLSKKQTVHAPTLKRRERHCKPWDAVKLCMANAQPNMKPKAKPSKNGPDRSALKNKRTNPANLRHFHADMDVPPWDESLGEFSYLTNSDRLRAKAYQVKMEAYGLAAHADAMDGLI